MPRGSRDFPTARLRNCKKITDEESPLRFQIVEYHIGSRVIYTSGAPEDESVKRIRVRRLS